ncbi:MAG: hypothetical protein V3U88_05130 [Methylococcales bacterium]
MLSNTKCQPKNRAGQNPLYQPGNTQDTSVQCGAYSIPLIEG